MLGIIDADSILWRVALAGADADAPIVRSRFDGFMSDMMLLDLDQCSDYVAYLTGPNNFRYGVATTVPYKGNRKQDKPAHFAMLWDYAIEEWGFVVTAGIEADDAVGIAATAGTECVIAHIDKDIDMIPGKHFNFVKRTHYTISVEEAIKKFYTQLLTGDRTDNIPGLHGIGPKKAVKILADCTTEQDLYAACLEAYEGNLTYLTEQANLLWIQQTSRTTWTPPN